MNAVIFDMDGVIVDSEPFWQQAEKEIFTSLGVKVTDELCKITQRMTTNEVTQFWYDRNPWDHIDFKTVENRVIDRVVELIVSEDCIVPGVVATVKKLKSKGLKLGLATNSPYRVIPSVLHKTKLTDDFTIIASAEFEKNGKPEPDVYLRTLGKLNEKAENCIVIEDSNSGIIAAKKAGIKVIAYTNNDQNLIKENTDYNIRSFEDIDYSIFDNNP